MTNLLFYRQPTAQWMCAIAGALTLALLAGCGVVKPVAVVVPVAPSHSVDEADRTLAQVMRERAQAEAAFAAGEQLCYAKFFVNNCLDVARDKHRARLSVLRAIEIEAEHFKRQAKVDERDRALAAAEQAFQAQQATMAAQAQAAARTPASAPAARNAGNAAKLKPQRGHDEVDAAKRAANVAAFEQRQRDAEQRQRDIANKKKAAPSEGEAP